jgi:MFS transporter, DHA1 family, tetracycline resistance protein
LSNLVPTDRIGEATGTLMGIYALFAFFSAPVFGNLSDQYGRKPLLLLSLLGSALGFFVFGIGQTLWVLVFGRIIDGITGGNVTILYSSLADATPREQRGRFYGLIGAVSGLGFMIGPAIGGSLARFGLRLPILLYASVTLALTVTVMFFFPETLDGECRKPLKPFRENLPWAVLLDAWNLTLLRPLFATALFFAMGETVFQALLPVLGYDSFRWTPELIGWFLFGAGLADIIIQAGLGPLGEKRIGNKLLAIAGVALFLIGFALLAVSLMLGQNELGYSGVALIVIGDSLVIPTLGALISMQVPGRDMGTVQGANLSLQSFARWVGPLAAGFVYSRIHPSLPFWVCAGLTLPAIWILFKVPLGVNEQTVQVSSH